MMKLLIFALTIMTVDAALFRTNSRDYRYYGNDVGSPLFLTPLIEAGKLDKGRELSRVLPIEGIKHESYAGYITVNKRYSSNLYFWFWPAQENPENAPVLLWLQGGPGGSSMFGMFVEIGPYSVNAQHKAIPKDITWNKKYSTLFIDNPVQTGYSFTHADAGFATNQSDVARDLYSCLVQFFTLFPQYAKNEFYLTGESYAGKYIPAIAYKIHIENPRAELKINLKGAAIGDGFTDPVTMVPQYADYIYNIGMFDENEREYFREQTNKGVDAINRADWMTAFLIFDEMLNGDISPYGSYYYNVTGLHDYDNFLRVKAPTSFGYYEKFLTSAEVRKAIHVGNLTYNNGLACENHMKEDFMKSEKAAFTVLVDNYRVLVYNGQLDVIVAAPLTEAFLQTVPWEGLNEYKKAKKLVWRIGDDVAGYVRNVRDFYQVIVRGGGHILPADQPARVLDMINRFINKQSFT